jgi:ribosomal protein S18 acetylase RimI-like enzyme
MTTPDSIRLPATSEVEQIKRLAIDTDMFTVEEADFFDETLAGFFDGSLEDNYWLVVEGSDGQVNAAAYFAPEPFSDRMWNLYFLSVSPVHQGRGLGASLIGAIEARLRSQGAEVARILIIETSSTDQYARTREFYRKLGYDEEARIRQFYGPTDDKVVFWKSLVAAPKEVDPSSAHDRRWGAPC